ncbi:N1R/p28-like protein [Choristoneura biennis entomopoxvirus]|uniref:N1R/p28-like protein n=1 Tax=Choristoneura biennis entomopoxvirus TaxID=10288 RepID=A0A916KPS2_CBEPV|nr:N1R/p28-like protein [Choristoneura biennis entomopoxvirus]CCU55818.1 N1R/p28-like protein [Choristoneura biennis entomopoxvirus]
MNSIKYNDINIKTLHVDSKIKYNMKDVFNALHYNNYEEYFNDNDDNRYYSLGLLKKRFNDTNNEKELIKYLENNTLMDIFTFINNNNYDFKLGDWFKDIWYPLLEQKDIIITNKILYFIHYGISGGDDHPPLDKYKIIRKDLEKILKNYNIEYNKIKYYRNIDKEYNSLIIEIENITSNNIIQKSWIKLSVRNFKKLILRLRTKVADEIRDYYIILEEILYDYAKHINNYNNNLKNKEIIQLKLEKEKAERRSLRLKEKIIEEKKHKMEQVIYISTSKSYAAQNRFKIGGVDNNNLLKPRLSTYNSRSAEGDEWYYTYIKKINNYKHFEIRFWSVMSSFRDKKDKEIIILYYNDLLNIFEFISENYDKDIEYFNEHVKIFIDNIDNDRYHIPEPYNIELVNICSIKNGKADNKLVIATKEIIVDEIKDYFKIKIESNELEIKRKDINDFIDKKYKFNKRDLWNISKEIKSIFNNIILKY